MNKLDDIRNEQAINRIKNGLLSAAKNQDKFSKISHYSILMLDVFRSVQEGHTASEDLVQLVLDKVQIEDILNLDEDVFEDEQPKLLEVDVVLNEEDKTWSIKINLDNQFVPSDIMRYIASFLIKFVFLGLTGQTVSNVVIE